MSIEGDASISRDPAERNVKVHQFNQPMNQNSPVKRQVVICVIINHNGRNSTPKFEYRFSTQTFREYFFELIGITGISEI